MNIEFVTATRTSLNSVEATYKLDETEFSVVWSNTDTATGNMAEYKLQQKTKSSRSDLASRVENAIRGGEIESNPDAELYRFLRETFSHADCVCFGTPAFYITSKEEFTAAYFDSTLHLIKLGGCTDNWDSYGLGVWTYQFEVDVLNQEGKKKSFTVAYQPLERNNAIQAYSGWEVTNAALYGYDADESTYLEHFCDYDTSVLAALHEIAEEAAKYEYERLIELLNNGDLELDKDVKFSESDRWWD